MKRVLILLSFFIVFPLSSTEESLYTQLSVENWREDTRFLETLDLDKIDQSLMNAAVFFHTNEIRLAHGLALVAHENRLETAANMHAQDMVDFNFFSHSNNRNAQRRTPKDRALLAGIPNPYIAENIANNFAIQYKAGARVHIVDRNNGIFQYPGETTPIPNHTYLSFAEALLTQWMNSPGHRSNILSSKALELGAGTKFYRDSNFFNMPKIMAVQKFQWFEKIQ